MCYIFIIMYSRGNTYQEFSNPAEVLDDNDTVSTAEEQIIENIDEQTS